MRQTTIDKYKSIQDRFKQLYHEEKLRSDYAIKLIKMEFFIASDTTVYRILSTKVS
jgi:hypothetical protein